MGCLKNYLDLGICHRIEIYHSYFISSIFLSDLKAKYITKELVMRLFEFTDAKASLELWNIVNDCVWKAISVQAQEQERRK